MPDVPCTHLDQIRDVERGGTGCAECLAIGSWWVHLRMCLTCGNIGCCDNSPNRHATAHFHAIGHPIIQSAEPDEAWGYCYPDDLYMETVPQP